LFITCPQTLHVGISWFGFGGDGGFVVLVADVFATFYLFAMQLAHIILKNNIIHFFKKKKYHPH
jgi:hypothetical protein